MTNIPEIIPVKERCQSPYSFASGSKVSKARYIIIPATAAIKAPTKTCGKKRLNRNIPTTAPIGSEIPERVAYNIA